MSIYIQGGFDQVEKDKLIQNREYQYTLYLFKKIITILYNSPLFVHSLFHATLSIIRRTDLNLMDPMAVTHSYQFHAYKIIILKITANISFLTTYNNMTVLSINAQIYIGI